MAMKATALSIGTWNRRLPRHIVPIQLNTFTADGTAITSVDTMNDEPSVGFIPLMNMWWPHTSHHMFMSGMNPTLDRKSTRLNSSHTVISYAVFCLKKKKNKKEKRKKTNK